MITATIFLKIHNSCRSNIYKNPEKHVNRNECISFSWRQLLPSCWGLSNHIKSMEFLKTAAFKVKFKTKGKCSWLFDLTDVSDLCELTERIQNVLLYLQLVLHQLWGQTVLCISTHFHHLPVDTQQPVIGADLTCQMQRFLISRTTWSEVFLDVILHLRQSLFTHVQIRFLALIRFRVISFSESQSYIFVTHWKKIKPFYYLTL